MDRGQIGFDSVVGTLTNLLENMSMDSLPPIQSVLKLHRICLKKKRVWDRNFLYYLYFHLVLSTSPLWFKIDIRVNKILTIEKKEGVVRTSFKLRSNIFYIKCDFSDWLREWIKNTQVCFKRKIFVHILEIGDVPR